MFEGGLAELLRFLGCQVEKVRKSRRIAAFLLLSNSKTEEVSSFVFKLADRHIDREITITVTATVSTTTHTTGTTASTKYTTLSNYTTQITLQIL